MAREMKNTHVRLGWTAASESKLAKWKPLTVLSSYEARKDSWSLTGISTFTGAGSAPTSVLYLTDVGALELVKGLLQELSKRPISMAADDEFLSILKVCQGQIAHQDAKAEQIIAAVRRTTNQQLGMTAPGNDPCTCGADRTGPSAEAHDADCPAAAPKTSAHYDDLGTHV